MGDIPGGRWGVYEGFCRGFWGILGYSGAYFGGILEGIPWGIWRILVILGVFWVVLGTCRGNADFGTLLGYGKDEIHVYDTLAVHEGV
jgi:hypothetical protein